MNSFIQEQVKKDLYNSYKEQCLLSETEVMSYSEWLQKEYDSNASLDDIDDEKIPEKYVCKYNFKLLKKKKMLTLDEAKNFIGVEMSTLKTYRSLMPSMTQQSIESVEVRVLLKERAKRDYRQYQKYCVSIGYLPASLQKWENKEHEEIYAFGSEWVSFSDASLIANSCTQTIERWVNQKWLYPHPECSFIVRVKDIKKIVERNKEENLIKCKECNKKMNFTSFLESPIDGVCSWCSRDILRREDENREAITKYCRAGDFLLVKDAGYINRKMIFSISPSFQNSSSKFEIIVKTIDDKEYPICNSNNDIIEFSEYSTALEVIRKLLK